MKRNVAQLIAAVAVALVVDLVTKAWAERVLFRYLPVEVVGDWLRLTLGFNEGIAFGLFATDGPGVIILSSLATLLIAIWIVHLLRGHPQARPPAWSLGLFLGGGLANVIDRIEDGRVTDFIDMGFGTHRWPTFNFADVFIMTGVAALMMWSYRRRPPAETTVESSETERSNHDGTNEP